MNLNCPECSAKEIKNEGIEKVSKRYEVIVNFKQSELKW